MGYLVHVCVLHSASVWVHSCFCLSLCTKNFAASMISCCLMIHIKFVNCVLCVGLLIINPFPFSLLSLLSLPRASHVPVGEDQLQHLELARDIARSFNSAYNTQVFTEPQPLLGLCARSKPSSFPLSRSKLSHLSPYLTPNFLAFPPISLPHTHRRSPASHESKKPSTKDE